MNTVTSTHRQTGAELPDEEQSPCGSIIVPGLKYAGDVMEQLIQQARSKRGDIDFAGNGELAGMGSIAIQLRY